MHPMSFFGSRLGRAGKRRLAALALATSALTALPQAFFASSAAAQSAGGEPVITAEDQAGFERWLGVFAQAATDVGIAQETIDRSLSGLNLSARVIAANENQPEFTRPIWQYLETAVSDTRIETGQQKLAEQAALLAQAEAQYGVPGRYLVAIWGMETNYGSFLGTHNVFEALATLGYEGRRTSYGRSQLLAALKIVDRGDKDPATMIGSWAGAMGNTQFIPTTYLDFAVDGDQDGRRDLWNSLPDVFSSTANYLERSGWERGLDWGKEVRLPDAFDYDLVDRSIRKPLSEWAALGITDNDGDPLPSVAVPGRIVLPAGHRGPAFVVFKNFEAILRYNNSTSYAIAVGHLADRIAGGLTFSQAWPTDVLPLSRSQRLELQSLLNARGFNAGKVDGIVGANTRNAIKAFQRSAGLIPDGYPSTALLDRLRGEG